MSLDMANTKNENDYYVLPQEDQTSAEQEYLVEPEMLHDTAYHSLPRRAWLQSPRSPYFLMVSILLNLVLVGCMFYYTIKAQHWATRSLERISPYTGLGYDMPYRFEYHNEYWGENETLADELWDNINTDGLVVALSRDYQAEHNLPASNPFPWDQSKGLYYIQSFHLLHCLKQLRRVITDYQRHNTTSIDLTHAFHCLDNYRQYTLCHADDTPMPGRYGDNAIGDGQMLQCRSMDKLRNWLREGDRNACFRTVDDLRPTAHTLEKYRFCDKTSPYYSNMEAYFRRYGHRNLFVDEGDGGEDGEVGEY